MKDLTFNRFEYEKLVKTVKTMSGINLIKDKDSMVKSRLLKRLKILKFNSFAEYIHYYESDKSGEEMQKIVEILTTNKTDFFREIQHFDFLEKKLMPLMKNKPYRIWSAGCSSGEEPYSLAMHIQSKMNMIERADIKILATDISSKMLEKAREAIYEKEQTKDIPEPFLKKYFSQIENDKNERYQISKDLKEMISFAKLNLVQQWPMRGNFDLILCRNVMIYFDRETREDLINRFWNMLGDGGFLFVGHSENLTGITSSFAYEAPAIYQKYENREHKRTIK